MVSPRLIRAVKGWLAGCLAASMAIEVVVVSSTAPSTQFAANLSSAVAIVVWTLPPVFLVTCVLTGFPAAVAIWLSERYQIRSLPFFACAGLVIGALGQTVVFWTFGWFTFRYIVAGLLAGITYWLVAGKRAGGERRPAA